MGKQSRDKGKRGERQLRDKFIAHGFANAHRSQQFSGKGESSADVEGIDGLHLECKVGYRYDTIYKFREQAEADCGEGKIPVVCCKMDRKGWLAILDLDDFIEIWCRLDPRTIGQLTQEELCDLMCGGTEDV